MPTITFLGEESARFTRFALACIAANLKVDVSVTGREPLTSRPIDLSGSLQGGKLEGYIRYIEVRENHSSIEYWIAGSNSTRSIAARLVRFHLSDTDMRTLEEYANGIDFHVPKVNRARDDIDRILWEIEISIENRSEDGLGMLLENLNHPDERVQLEAALTLRAYSGFVVESGRRQYQSEKLIVDAVKRIPCIEAKIALVEDLGYLGSEASISLLADLLAEESEDPQVRWAASIALGRLPNVDPTTQLIPGLNCELDWVQAATLLSISRHATSKYQSELEEIFRRYLGAEFQPMMVRYACLGLSKFGKHEDSTSKALIAVLGDDELSVDVRGYAALAMAAGIFYASEETITNTKQILESFAKYSHLDIEQPEAIWALEFLAELASILELNEVSSALHGYLADNFDDWRSRYYSAMKFYEQGESSARRGLGDDAIHAYARALTALRLENTNLPVEVAATIQFRRDMIEARQRLQSLLGSWLAAVSSADIRSLLNPVDPIREAYRRYVFGGATIGKDRHLIERELSYIKNTSELVAVIKMLIDFDSQIRNRAFREDEMPLILQALQESLDAIQTLKIQFEGQFAHSLREVIEEVILNLKAMEEAFTSSEIGLSDRLRFARSTMIQIRSSFWKASWPMPGRACPVYGLGRASISVRTEGIDGSGTIENPLLFPANDVPVILLTAHIFEMAPGANLYLEQQTGTAIERTHIPIVEDHHTFSIYLGRSISTVVPTRVDLTLVFSARDCTQKADATHVYLLGREHTESKSTKP